MKFKKSTRHTTVPKVTRQINTLDTTSKPIKESKLTVSGKESGMVWNAMRSAVSGQ